MGLHQRHTHGRVFRGEDAREQLKIRKRDSHGNSIRLHVPEGFQAKQVAEDDSDYGMSVVYVTLPQTFEGPAMYSTLTGEYNPDATEAATNVAPNFFTGTAEESARATKTASDDDVVATASAMTSNNIKYAQMTTFATASSAAATVIAGTPVQATRAATATAASLDSQDAGMSTGTRAGLAIGIILAVGLACGLVFFCWRRKRGVGHGEVLNEKHGSFADVGARRAEANGLSARPAGSMAAGMATGAVAGGAAVANKRDSSMTEKVPSSLRSTRTTSTAPRLSLRPVTEFLPMLGDNKEKNNSAWERTPSNNGADPFADAPVLSDREARAESPPSNPFDEQRISSGSNNGAAVAGAAAGVAVAGAAAAHANGQTPGPNTAREEHEPATAKSAQFSTAAPVPVAAGAGNGAPPPPRQPNNVHRVQLDFKPSMDDELELVSGALVRLLHEYDDGWALCISMDRSKQGVAPRTCLSKLPVKPRPQGPPPPQGFRPGTPGGSTRGPPPQQGARRPSNPHAPNGSPGAMQPRPLTPQSTPSQTSARPGTSGGAPTSPVGFQLPSRKPVPGQAM